MTTHTEPKMTVQQWLDSLKTPEGFPVILPGWPDEEYGIHQAAWEEYCDDLAEDCASAGEPYEPDDFETWRERRRADIPETQGFSHFNCDICGALPGERHAMTAFPENFTDENSSGEYMPLEVCSDCLLWFVNGDIAEWLEE
jgi:hypothetical protein